jgi:hypothetical protein
MKPNKQKTSNGSLNPDENKTRDDINAVKETQINDRAQEKNKKSQKNAELESKFGDYVAPGDSNLKAGKNKNTKTK